MREISTNKLSNRKNVLIDGHHYIVRRMGAGDKLTVNQCMRELLTLQKKETSKAGLSEQDLKRIQEIEALALDITARSFDDREDGTRAKKLIKSLSEEDLGEIMAEVFKDESEEDTAEEAGTDTKPTGESKPAQS